MKKLLNIPEQIDEVLKNYKKETGMNVSSYILRAIYKAMIHDNLITIKKVVINVDEFGNIIEKDPEEKEK